MKKLIFYLAPFVMYFIPCGLTAQQVQITDSNFENGWIDDSGAYGHFTDYKTSYFYTLNSLRAIYNTQGPADLTAFKEENNPKEGNSSIKLVSGKISTGADIFLPGMVGTVSEDYVKQYLDTNRKVILSRYWDNDTPHALEGWYKYSPVAGDSALIEIGFAKSPDKEPVFLEKLIIKTPVSAWTHFSIPIPPQYWNQYFEEIRMLFVASAGVNFHEMTECKGQRGTTLWIDAISLNYNLGIKQNLFSTLDAKLFPNPAHEVLHIELNENFSGTVNVYNLSGSLVMEQAVNGTQCQLNTSALATGNYIYKLIRENTIFSQGKFMITK